MCLGVVVMMEGSRKTGEGGGPDTITQRGVEEQAAQSGPWIKRVEGVEGCRDADWMFHGPQCVQTPVGLTALHQVSSSTVLATADSEERLMGHSIHCPNPLSGFLVSISLSPLHPPHSRLGIFIECCFHYVAADCPEFDTSVV